MTKDSLFQLIHTAELVNSHTVVKFMKTFERNISISQIIVLYELKGNGPQMPSRLAKKLGYTSGALTGIIDKLVKGEYIVRHASQEDRRTSYCTITDKGLEVLKEAHECGIKIHQEIFSVLDGEEIDQLINIQLKLLNHLEENQVTEIS